MIVDLIGYFGMAFNLLAWFLSSKDYTKSVHLFMISSIVFLLYSIMIEAPPAIWLNVAWILIGIYQYYIIFTGKVKK